jgi:hypothetical protein
MAQPRLISALYGVKYIRTHSEAQTSPKRQPAGTGSRWRGGLRPCPALGVFGFEKVLRYLAAYNVEYILPTMRDFLKNNWEQLFFGLVGLILLLFSFTRLWLEDLPGASATFAMAFFSFIYSNVSRFKRFKGLGFEAELWEDKQKEAEHLIERLKSVVSVYTREVVLQRVMQGRWSDGSSWEDNWALYDDLVKKHNELGQEIDFSDLKKTIDGIFLFDIVSKLYSSIREPIVKGHGQARDMIGKEFGSPIKDSEGYRKRLHQLNEIEVDLKDLYTISMSEDAALYVLNWSRDAQDRLRAYFEIDIDLPEAELKKLSEISKLYERGPIAVTDELVSLANYK